MAAVLRSVLKVKNILISNNGVRNYFRQPIFYRNTLERQKLEFLIPRLPCNLSTNIFKRCIHITNVLQEGEYEWEDPKSPEDVVNVVYVDKTGTEFPIKGKIGDNILFLARRHRIPMEGACNGSLSCTTCHIYMPHDMYDKLSEEQEHTYDRYFALEKKKKTGLTQEETKEFEELMKKREDMDEEGDLLDLALFKKENSRLGCQICLRKDMEGMRLELPLGTLNYYPDDKIPEH